MEEAVIPNEFQLAREAEEKLFPLNTFLLKIG